MMEYWMPSPEEAEEIRRWIAINRHKKELGTLLTKNKQIKEVFHEKTKKGTKNRDY